MLRHHVPTSTIKTYIGIYIGAKSNKNLHASLQLGNAQVTDVIHEQSPMVTMNSPVINITLRHKPYWNDLI